MPCPPREPGETTPKSRHLAAICTSLWRSWYLRRARRVPLRAGNRTAGAAYSRADMLANPVHPFLEGPSHRFAWPVVELVGWGMVLVLVIVVLADWIQDWVWRRRNRRAGLGAAAAPPGEVKITEHSAVRRHFWRRVPPTTRVLTRRGFSATGGTGVDDYSPTDRRRPVEPQGPKGGRP